MYLDLIPQNGFCSLLISLEAQKVSVTCAVYLLVLEAQEVSDTY